MVSKSARYDVAVIGGTILGAVIGIALAYLFWALIGYPPEIDISTFIGCLIALVGVTCGTSLGAYIGMRWEEED